MKLIQKLLKRSHSPFTRRQSKPGLSLLLAGLLWGAIALPAQAAQRVTIRLGPFQHSVNITDLETFARTGQVSASLKPFESLLTPSVRQMLTQRLMLDPTLGDKVIDNILRSPAGSQIFRSLGMLVPGTNIEQLQAALAIALRQANELSAIEVLKAFPEENITINASAAVSVALKFNASYLQSQALGPLLERDLTVPGSFQPAFDPAAPGRQSVRQKTLNLHDWKRDRTIPVDLYWADIPVHPYGTNPSPPGPLVVISHGFGADRSYLAYLAHHLASHGLTVAAIEHPGSNISWLLDTSNGRNLQNVVPETEFTDRPRDVSFLLDELEKINRRPGILRGQLQTDRVTVIGHSLGGYTALALGGAQLDLSDLRQYCREQVPITRSAADWLQCAATDLPNQRQSLRDERVVQIMALNPLVGRLFGKRGINQVKVPTLILSSTNDAITPALDHQLRPFAQLNSPKYLITAIGGTHLSIGNLSGYPRNNLAYELQGQPVAPLRQLLQGVSLAFIKQLTPASETYKPFLSPQYAQYLSTPELPLRFSRSLPGSLSEWVEMAALLNWLRLG